MRILKVNCKQITYIPKLEKYKNGKWNIILNVLVFFRLKKGVWLLNEIITLKSTLLSIF